MSLSKARANFTVWQTRENFVARVEAIGGLIELASLPRSRSLAGLSSINPTTLGRRRCSNVCQSSFRTIPLSARSNLTAKRSFGMQFAWVTSTHLKTVSPKLRIDGLTRNRADAALVGSRDVRLRRLATSEIGTFETCRPTRRMSVYRGRPEVDDARSE